ncbi:MAG: hypothetical protein RLZZ08_107 [Pseudomonadota bacterium]|jgi:lysophospholipase L1-like esterase
MSAVDAAARGSAARALREVMARPKTLLAQDRSGPVAFTAATQTFRTMLATTIPGGAIIGGGQLRLRGQIAKYAPFTAGHAWRARLVQGANSVVIAQNTIGASLSNVLIDQSVFVSSDRRWGFAYSLNALAQATLATGQVAATGASTSPPSTLNPNGTSTSIAFATYSAAPIVETLLIDFAQPVEFRVELAGQSGDVLELVGFGAELVAAHTGRASNFVPAGALCCWGDSLTQGSGATAVAGVPYDYPSQLRRMRTGRPMINRGLGGQTAVQIVDRLVADPIHGKSWDAVVWLGINDASTSGAAWWATLELQINRLLAFRAPAARTMFVNFHPRTDWPAGNAFNAALQFVNAQLAAKLGSRVVDVYTPLLTGGTAGAPNAAYMADTIHLNNTGYGIVTTAVDARMTALGW